MDTPESSPRGVRRHGRNTSHPTLRRTMMGPLEAADDPLAQPPQSTTVTPATEPSQPVSAAESPQPPAPSDSPIDEQPFPEVHLSFLQRRENYHHQLTNEDVPSAFLESEHRPALDAELDDLLQHGHFRLAAELALRNLIQSPPGAFVRIFDLLYTRLACLVLISRADFAAQEAVPLTEFLSHNAPGTEHIIPVIPWDLRVLLVRLQSLGASDGGRRGIMALYALTSEVRANLRRARVAGNADRVRMWTTRLQDLGLRVADALVGMGELDTATRHLDTLSDVDQDEIFYRKALLRVRVGDVIGARRCVEKISDTAKKHGLDALLSVADGDYQEALDTWQTLIKDCPSHELFAHNAAISMLYTGHIVSARDLLEDVTKRLPMFPTLLFNLSTVYELCTERAIERKTKLSQDAASKPPGPESGGWERSNFEFKL